MREYHKINSIYKRDQETGKFIVGEFSRPEFDYLIDLPWVFTEKVDGMNMRVRWSPESPGIIMWAGRTDMAQIPGDLATHIVESIAPEKMAEVFAGVDGEVFLHGEGYGAGIQKGGGRYLPHKAFVLFDVQVGDLFLDRENVDDVATNLGIDSVPTVLVGTLREGEALAQRGFDSAYGEARFPAEGIVGVPAVGLRDRRGNRIVIKMKTKDYQ